METLLFRKWNIIEVKTKKTDMEELIKEIEDYYCEYGNTIPEDIAMIWVEMAFNLGHDKALDNL